MRFGDTVGLRDVPLQVDAGESVAVVGPSGAGKSTLLHCLAGLVQPTSGTVVAGGERLDRLDAEALARHRRRVFGFVFQAGLLVADLSLEENVALPLMLDGVARRLALRRAAAGLAEVGIQRLASRLPGEVSGGEAQRATIARALVARPRIVFADEPTGSLDSVNAELVLGLLLAAVRDHGAALLLVTHDQAMAGRLDRVVQLRDGRLTGGGEAGA
jgi:putative ABC transport system ATP-binding protein